jgi:tRNA A-37 threonylcarbamoyl transferase component Bud32
MLKTIKTLQGFSGSHITLMQQDDQLFVRKANNVVRNYQKLEMLDAAGYPVPAIINYADDVLDMEYIHGLDITNYLLNHNQHKLTEFIIDIINKFKHTSTVKDYTVTYAERLQFVDTDRFLPFTRQELMDQLPKELPCSLCHGDFTLENIIYADDGTFFVIDPSTGPYDSWIFDLAKMRQDLDAKWFLRNKNAMLDVKLQSIKHTLEEHFPQAFDDALYILMLLRVYVYAVPNSKEHKLLLSEIQRVWK